MIARNYSDVDFVAPEYYYDAMAPISFRIDAMTASSDRDIKAIAFLDFAYARTAIASSQPHNGKE